MEKRTRFKFSWIFILLGGVWGFVCTLLFSESAIRVLAMIAGAILLGYTGAKIDIRNERRNRIEKYLQENQIQTDGKRNHGEVPIKKGGDK